MERSSGCFALRGIHSADGKRQSPRLHSLRHTFATNRLTAWYRQSADVQRLLPVLSRPISVTKT